MTRKEAGVRKLWYLVLGEVCDMQKLESVGRAEVWL